MMSLEARVFPGIQYTGKDLHPSCEQLAEKLPIVNSTHTCGSKTITSSVDIKKFLVLMAATGNTENVKWTFDICANADILDRNLLTKTLLVAVQNGHSSIVDLIYQNNPLFTVQASILPPLFCAILNRDYSIVTTLCEKGADINGSMFGGLTPLQIAAIFGLGDMVDLLLEKGALVKAKSKSKLTAQKLAKKVGHTEVASKLERHSERQKVLTIPKVPTPNDINLENIDKSQYSQIGNTVDYHNYVKPVSPGMSEDVNSEIQRSVMAQRVKNSSDDGYQNTRKTTSAGNTNEVLNENIGKGEDSFENEDGAYSIVNVIASSHDPLAGQNDEACLYTNYDQSKKCPQKKLAAKSQKNRLPESESKTDQSKSNTTVSGEGQEPENDSEVGLYANFTQTRQFLEKTPSREPKTNTSAESEKMTPETGSFKTKVARSDVKASPPVSAKSKTTSSANKSFLQASTKNDKSVVLSKPRNATDVDDVSKILSNISSKKPPAVAPKPQIKIQNTNLTTAWQSESTSQKTPETQGKINSGATNLKDVLANQMSASTENASKKVPKIDQTSAGSFSGATANVPQVPGQGLKMRSVNDEFLQQLKSSDRRVIINAKTVILGAHSQVTIENTSMALFECELVNREGKTSASSESDDSPDISQDTGS